MTGVCFTDTVSTTTTLGDEWSNGHEASVPATAAGHRLETEPGPGMVPTYQGEVGDY